MPWSLPEARLGSLASVISGLLLRPGRRVLQRKQRVCCSPWVTVAALQQAFSAALETVDNQLPQFLKPYEALTFKMSPSCCVALWLQHEQFWSLLLRELPDQMLPVTKARMATQACYAVKKFAEDAYLKVVSLAALIDRALGIFKVQLSKFRELKEKSSVYQAVAKKCTIQELAALNRLLDLATDCAQAQSGASAPGDRGAVPGFACC